MSGFLMIDGGVPVITPQDHAVLATSSSPSGTFNFGAAQADRWVIAAMSSVGGFATTINSVLIGGSAATIFKKGNFSSGGANYVIGIAGLLVPSGASGTIEVDFNAGCSHAGISVFSLTGWQTGNFAAAQGNPGSLNLNTQVNSSVIGAEAAQDSFITDPTVTATWTGLTEYADFTSGGSFANHSSAYGNFSVAETPRAISVTGTWTQAAIGASCVFWN